MSIMLASSKNVPSETSAEALRREIAERAQRAYDRSLRLRRIVIAASLTFSLGQCVYSIARPGTSELLLTEAAVWGAPLLASLLTMSLVWSCRLHRDQSQQQYTAYLRRTRQLADASENRLASAA
jgi:hypothetical protein